jgi:hypothetical protein
MQHSELKSYEWQMCQRQFIQTTLVQPASMCLDSKLLHIRLSSVVIRGGQLFPCFFSSVIFFFFVTMLWFEFLSTRLQVKQLGLYDYICIYTRIYGARGSVVS